MSYTAQDTIRYDTQSSTYDTAYVILRGICGLWDMDMVWPF